MADLLAFHQFDEAFLDASARWQQDPEVRALTNAAPFSKAAQLEWYESLKQRSDYFIWGVSLHSIPIGAVGLKGIEQGAAEYFGYIGERQFWGKGLGIQMVEHAEHEAFSKGITVVRLQVSKHNVRAIRLYQKANYRFCMNIESNLIIMVKFLPFKLIS